MTPAEVEKLIADVEVVSPYARLDLTASKRAAFIALAQSEWTQVKAALRRLSEENARLRGAVEAIDALAVMEINPSNYDHDDVCELNGNAVQAALIARAALTAQREGEQP